MCIWYYLTAIYNLLAKLLNLYFQKFNDFKLNQISEVTVDTIYLFTPDGSQRKQPKHPAIRYLFGKSVFVPTFD